MIKRLKYVSRHARLLSDEDIADIAASSQRNNAATGVTGVFMTSGGLFFQVLEGPVGAVDATYERIAADDRHTNMWLLGEPELSEHRLFPQWAMRRVVRTEDADSRIAPLHALLDIIAANQQQNIDLSLVLERSIWRALHATT